jgi:hypothetical protein
MIEFVFALEVKLLVAVIYFWSRLLSETKYFVYYL